MDETATLDALRALLLRRCATDLRALELLEAPGWDERLRRAAAVKRRLLSPAAPKNAPPGEDACASEDEQDLAMLRVALRAWEGAVPCEDEVTDPALRAWRARQRARCDTQLTRANARGLLHPPLSLTLSRGCSVQCWFCSQAAPPLSSVYAHTPANTRLWRDVLEAAADVIGPAARTGYCYADTEPFDNPEYELFASDFHDVLGQFPQTTTARALSDPGRTRGLLALSLERDGPRVRFSVLSAAMLRRLYREFTPEELLTVELILHVPDGHARFRSGRARERLRDRPGLSTPIEGTSSCLSGFLVEMIGRTVSLEAPWPADDRRPLGSVVYAKETFRDGRDLARVMRRMIARHMPAGWPAGPPARFRDDVSGHCDEGRLTLTSPHASHTLAGGAALETLGSLLTTPGHCGDDVAAAMHWHGWTAAQTRQMLDRLFDAGLLDETALAG